MDRLQKKAFVSNLKQDLKKSQLLIVTQYSGLNVGEIEDLRSKMREVGVKFKVSKNKLVKLALPDTSFKNTSELFIGPTAIAYSEDPILAAKVAVNFSRSNNKLKIIGGSFEGKLIGKDQVKFLASLPSLDELRAKLISIIQMPAKKIATILQVPGSQIAQVINAYAKKTN